MSSILQDHLCLANALCGRWQVLSYLQLFADMHELHQHIQYNTQVLSADNTNSTSSGCSSNPRWQLTSVQLDESGQAVGDATEQVVAASQRGQG